MLFDNLKSALADIDALGDYNLDRLIKHYDIDVQYANMTHTINGYTLPLTRTIFINNQLDYTERIKAHELMHCLLDDTVQPLIESIMVDGSKTENRADRGAFYVMIKEYIELTNIEPEDFDVLRFCKQYHIPDRYIFLAANVAEDALSVTIPDLDLY